MGKARDKKIKDVLSKVKAFKQMKGFDRIILFGSYARGDYKKDSDVDLVIVDKRFKGKNSFKRSKGLWIDWHVKRKNKYPVDFICYNPEEFKKLSKRVSIVSEALREGIEV